MNSSNGAVVLYADWDYEISTILWIILAPFLTVLGTIGNCLTIVVLSSKHMGSYPPAPYLCVIAVADTLALFAGLSHRWGLSVFGVDYTDLNLVVCKIRMWAVYTFSHVAVWLVIALTIDRLVCVSLPLKAASIRRKHRVVVIIIILALFGALNAHFFVGQIMLKFTMTVSNVTETVQYCIMGDAVFTNVGDVVASFDLAVFCIVPFTILALSNIGLIVSLRSSRSSVGRMGEGRRKNEQRSGDQRITLLVLLITFMYFITTMPISLLLLYNNLASNSEFTGYRITFVVIFFFGFLNHAINFLLYCISGPRFRKAFLMIFTNRKKDSSGHFTIQSTDATTNVTKGC